MSGHAESYDEKHERMARQLRIAEMGAENQRLREALERIDSNAKRLRIDQGRGLDDYVREALRSEQ